MRQQTLISMIISPWISLWLAAASVAPVSIAFADNLPAREMVCASDQPGNFRMERWGYNNGYLLPPDRFDVRLYGRVLKEPYPHEPIRRLKVSKEDSERLVGVYPYGLVGEFQGDTASELFVLDQHSMKLTDTRKDKAGMVRDEWIAKCEWILPGSDWPPRPF